ncbi:hypothetical protein HG536_0G01750 [Torulaspora globosa]|uniref:Beige protein homolog 1 n=1 Tax=Torulaspora globosa TaxID=48254 RepID=A0A7G3ZLD0_9SACH|nr:uncharacterized protein HG536_0G01750 [Torulaspora globosa]QLL34316.1 hypothetical protein HG536_0G01750 [Torulaspora globosa]
MSDESKALAVLLQEALSVTLADSQSEAAIQDHFNEIILNYSFDRVDEQDYSEGFVCCDMRTYVESELATRFELPNFELSLNVDATAVWSQLFETHWNSIEYALTLQIIISLTNFSVLNRSKIGSVKDIKKRLFHRTINADDVIPIVRDRLSDLLSLVLTVDCTPADLLELYARFLKYPINRTADALAAQLCDPLSQAFFLFENCYYILNVPRYEEDNRYTFQYFMEFNSVTSNRITTLGADLYLEIDDGKFCVSNDEFVMALFEGFEFEAGTLYSIAVTIEGNDISLHVNGNLIDRITLLDGATNMTGQVDLGSMICSFKLYRLTVYHGSLPEDTIKAAYALGSTFHYAWNETTDLRAIRLALGDLFLQRSSSSMDFSNHFIDCLLETKREIDSKSICLDIDPAFVHLEKHPNNGWLSPDDAFFHATTGKFLHFKPALLLAMFKSINCFQFILCSLEKVEDWDDLFRFLSHLMTLLQNNHLRAWFTQDYGFPLLSHILVTKVQRNMKSTLPIQFFNLFQEFCGWNFSNITKSVIEDDTAYQALILNTDLWYRLSMEVNASRDGVEILRFSLFQISSLLQASEFRTLNSQKLRNLEALKKLCINQHVFAEKYGYPSIFTELATELSHVYVLLLKEELSRGNIQWLLQFAYFELRSGYYKNAEASLAAFDTLFVEVLDNAETSQIRLITDSISPKFSLMILDEVVNAKGDPLIALRILLKRLLVNQTVYKNFVKSNGLDLVLAILKKADSRYNEDIVCLLYAHSLGHYSIDPNVKVPDVLENDSPHSEATVVMKEILILAVNLLEWTVINDISSTIPLDLDRLIKAFVRRLSASVEKFNNELVLHSITMTLFQALTELHATLTRPQNSAIYEGSSNAIKKLISDTVVNAMMSLKPDDFAQYLEAMINWPDIKMKALSMNGKQYGYHELSFFWLLIPGVFKGIREMGDFFSYELFSNDCMILNFELLFEKVKRYLISFRFEWKVYIDAFKCIVICLKGARKRWRVKKSSLSSLSDIFRFTVIVALLQYVDEEWEFMRAEYLDSICSLLAEHSGDIFMQEGSLWNYDFARLFLWILLRHVCTTEPSRSIMVCFEMLLKYRAESLNPILESEGFKLPEILEALRLNSETNHQESKEVRAFIEHNRNTVIPYALSVTKKKTFGPVFPQERFMVELNVIKDTKMETRIEEVRKRLQLFRNDNVVLDRKVWTGFRKIYVNFLTDRGEDELLHEQQCFSFAVHLKHTSSLQRSNSGDCEWGLDSVQNSNGMKGHLVSVWRHLDYDKVEKQMQRTLQDEDTANISQQNQTRNTNNSFLSYDLISDIDSLKQSGTENEDENRKILKLLQGSDGIKKIWNTSLIIGLKVREGVLIMGDLYLYFVSNYYFVKEENKVLKLTEIPDADRDITLSLITGSPGNQRGMSTSQIVHTWRMSDLTFIVKRPFLLRETALEILFENGTSYLFNFNSKSYRDDAYHILDKLPSNKEIDPVLYSTLQELNSCSGSIGLKNGLYKKSLKTKLAKAFSANLTLTDGFSATQKWQKGEISNFYYLMMVNALAGRTFNDITQYPVFPWVIADYTSEELDLKSAATFRDLTKPMGAQSRRREVQFIERFEMLKALDDPSSPPFHYGTHYSSAMIVSSYLIRLKPYVDTFLLLQDGRFGHADRLFNSIDRAWSSAAVENTTDVRELIPEFFFLPEFLINLNNFDLGKDQQGNQVNDVILPPWAKGDPKIFIAKNREALESPYVSANLHHWIDLIFGVKQRGEEAELAVNVFNNLSYPGAVDLDSISDENERRAVTGIIHNFGQTPLQIFHGPHPPKSVLKLKQIEERIWNEIRPAPQRVYEPDSKCSKLKGIKYIYCEPHVDGSICWKGYPFLDVMIRSGPQLVPLKIREPYSLEIGGKIYEMLHPCRICSFFLWKEDKFLTGDENGLIQAWGYDKPKEVELTCLGKLHGHLSAVKDIKLYFDYSALLSVDVSGTVYLWNLLDYQIIRRISSTGLRAAISQNEGNIAVYTMDRTLALYDFGGSHYLSKLMDDKAIVTCLEFVNFTSPDLSSKRHAYWKEKDVLVVGYDNGELEIYELILTARWELKKLKQLHSAKNFEISSIRTQLRLYCNDDDSKISLELPKLEIMAGDSQGYLYLWN